jgi:hypothetical protein
MMEVFQLEVIWRHFRYLTNRLINEKTLEEIDDLKGHGKAAIHDGAGIQ